MLQSLRLAGWFDDANGIVISRTSGGSLAGLTQEEAVRRALRGLGVPVILDFDTGHQSPQMPMVNGALAEITLADGSGTIAQHLIP